MPDMFSAQKRSEIMSRIRSKGTEAERITFKYLRQNKIYFQKHYARVAGKPDIALPRKKKAFLSTAIFDTDAITKESLLAARGATTGLQRFLTTCNATQRIALNLKRMAGNCLLFGRATSSVSERAIAR